MKKVFYQFLQKLKVIFNKDTYTHKNLSTVTCLIKAGPRSKSKVCVPSFLPLLPGP